MTLKKNRSDTFTQGVCITFENDTENRRMCFFELDNTDKRDLDRVLDNYRLFGLDCLYHRTRLGYHFLSPTVVSLDTWKQFMDNLKDLNKKCPMTTLRVQPNKYPNEDQIWYTSEILEFFNKARNSKPMCVLLYHWFRKRFNGDLDLHPKLVRYPLPRVEA